MAKALLDRRAFCFTVVGMTTVTNADDLLRAFEQREPEIEVIKQITLREPLVYRGTPGDDSSLVLWGNNLLGCMKGIRIMHISRVEIRNVFTENPGADGEGDGLELRGNRDTPIEEAIITGLSVGRCGDEQLSIRGCVNTQVDHMNSYAKSERGVFAYHTADGQLPDPEWDLQIRDSHIIASKRLPLSYINALVGYSHIEGWDNDCAKTLGEGRIRYVACRFTPKRVGLAKRIVDRLGFRVDELHVVGNDEGNTRRVSKRACVLERGCRFY